MAPSRLQAAHRLAGLLDRENNALRALDLRGAVAFLPEKTAAIAQLAEADAAAGDAPAAVLDVAKRLETLTRDNRLLLDRAIHVQQRVIGIVVQAAADAVGREPVYGAKGRLTSVSGPMALSTRA